MNLYSPPYPGRKRSRTCRFPALAQDRMRAINSALPCRCEGLGIFAATAPCHYRPVAATSQRAFSIDGLHSPIVSPCAAT
jgi:hypothetical protein